jgi:hypothetical protein
VLRYVVTDQFLEPSTTINIIKTVRPDYKHLPSAAAPVGQLYDPLKHEAIDATFYERAAMSVTSASEQATAFRR